MTFLESGLFVPKVKEFANPGFEKLLSRGFKPPLGMELKDQAVEAFLIRSKESEAGRVYMVSVGPPVVVAALNALIVDNVTISYKKFDLRVLCDFLFKHPNFSNLLVRRLNVELSGRENPGNVSRCSINGPDVFKSNFLSDLIGVANRDGREDFSPFLGGVAKKRSRWSIEPTSCRVNFKSEGRVFWINLDRYGNFLFHFKADADMLLLAGALDMLYSVSSLLDCGIPLRKEDEKLEEKSPND